MFSISCFIRSRRVKGDWVLWSRYFSERQLGSFSKLFWGFGAAFTPDLFISGSKYKTRNPDTVDLVRIFEGPIKAQIKVEYASDKMTDNVQEVS